MKAFIIFLFLAVALYSCTNTANETDLSGIYVNKSHSEYSIAFDTIIVSKKSSANYEVARKTGFQKIRNGTALSKEYKFEKWPAQWDAQKMVLSETDLGRQITLNKGGKSINLKNTEYLKIK